MKPNPQQDKVINHVNGPALVIAVPGSGKTTVVTERTKHLVSIGVNPESILAITFTNKSADEMKTRISKAVGAKSKYITICTFHSLCARILRENTSLIGLQKNYTIYDTDDQKRLLKNCIIKVNGEEVCDIDDYLNPIINYIEWQRNKCLTQDEALTRFGIDGKQLKVIEMYYQQLRESNAIDFTGLISETNRLFEENPIVRDYYRKKWKFISVDEVQDTCVAQFKIVVHLAGEHKNVLVVGDNDQALYRFRGASPENIFSFEKEFSPVIYKLEKNYRSTPEILKFSHNLIVNNKMRKDAELTTDNSSGDEPFLNHYQTELEMVDGIVSEVRERIKNGTPREEIALLYRTNFLSKSLEMGLQHARIPFRVIGGVSFWDRKEIKTCVSILKYMCNPTDAIAFASSLESCCKGVGDKFVTNVIDHAKQNSISFVSAAKELSTSKKSVSQTVSQFIEELGKSGHAATQLADIVNNTGFLYRISKGGTIEDDRQENVNELIRDFRMFVDQGGSLASYLQNISLMSSSDTKSTEGRVNLMTTHSSKGLEFDAVLLTYAIEGVMPHKRVLELEEVDPVEYAAQLEEERRIFYVAMTRAKKFLRVYACKERYRGQYELSRFAYESNIPIERHSPKCQNLKMKYDSFD